MAEASKGKSRGTARDRLERILYLLPAAATEKGAPLDELCEDLGVSRDVLLGDLEELTARAYYHPAGGGDDLQVFLEPDRVRVWTTGEFRRPPKLAPREALALGLGLRVLAAEAGGDGRDELLALARRLEAELAAAPPEELLPRFAIEDAPVEPSPDPARPEPTDVDRHRVPDAAVLRGRLVEAAREGRRCGFRYLKPDADAPEVRRLEPYAVVEASGRWYAVGRDPDRDAMRAFRLDRMLDTEVLETPFEPAPDFELDRFLSGGRVFWSSAATEARVRYSPAIARWILERGVGAERADGSAVATHRVADPTWAVRHVLQYGGDAELLGPGDLRRRVAAAARDVVRVHAA